MSNTEIISKGRAVSVTEEQLTELRENKLGWHLYCQRRLTMSHEEAIASMRRARADEVYSGSSLKIAKQVFGAALPAGATSFTTDGRTATFCIGRTGELVDVPFTDSQAEALRNNGMLGTFGVELVERQERASSAPAP